MSISFPPKGDSDKKIGAYLAPLSVQPQDTPNMTVKIRAGSYFNTANQYVEFAGGSSPAIVAPVSGASWSLVSLSDAGSVVITPGAAAIAPVFPSLPVGNLPLAAVYLTATTFAITAANITDIRPIVRSIDVIPNLPTELASRPTITDMNNALATKADVGSVAVGPHAHVVADISDYVSSTTGLVNAAVAPKANDTDVVHLSGNEVVAGNKTFTGAFVVQPTGFQPIGLFSTQTASAGDAGVSVTRGANPPAILKWDETSLTWQAGIQGSSVHTILTSGTISSKADKVTGAVVGHFAGLDASGNLVDSGKATSDFATAAQGLLAATALQSNQTITLSGDVTGSGSTSIATTLASVGTPLSGAFVKITTDAKGRVISSANVLATDIANSFVVPAGQVFAGPITGATNNPAFRSLAATDIPNIDQSQVIDLTTDLGAKADVNSPVFTGIPSLPAYTLSTLPTGVVGGIIMVSDANSAVGAIAFYNGTTWIDVGTGLTVA